MTLIELMIVVAVIAVLSAVAIVAYRKYTNKARAAEVVEMFGKFNVAEANYQAEFGSYKSTGDYFPSAIKGSEATALGALKAEWNQLKIKPGRDALYCQYKAVAGKAGDNSGMDSLGTKVFGTVPPTTSWYYLGAQCDFNNNGTFSVYAMRHDRSQMYKENEGD